MAKFGHFSHFSEIAKKRQRSKPVKMTDVTTSQNPDADLSRPGKRPIFKPGPGKNALRRSFSALAREPDHFPLSRS